MNDKEKIRAYIEKLHKEHRGSEGDSIFRRALRTVLFYIDSMQEEPISEDLEEAVNNYIKENGYDGLDSREEVKYIANHFANWQKEQILKDAIETTIMDDWIYGRDPDNSIRPAIHQRIDGYKIGDKVKIVILKEG